MKVLIRSIARQDILDQFQYLIEQGVSRVAERFIDAVDETISQLSRNPHMGAPKRLSDIRLKGLRRWPVKGFEVVHIYYLAGGGALKVIRVLHSKRDVEHILDTTRRKIKS